MRSCVFASLSHSDQLSTLFPFFSSLYLWLRNKFFNSLLIICLLCSFCILMHSFLYVRILHEWSSTALFAHQLFSGVNDFWISPSHSIKIWKNLKSGNFRRNERPKPVQKWIRPVARVAWVASGGGGRNKPACTKMTLSPTRQHNF